MTALPRLPARARRALEAAGITTLEDCVREGRRAVAALNGLDAASMAVLDEAVLRAGAGEVGAGEVGAAADDSGVGRRRRRGSDRVGDVLLAG